MINIVDYDSFILQNKLIGPVSSPQLFMGNSNMYHPKGLFSEDIFGIDGSNERRELMSWVELNCNVIHPVIYDILSKKIERRFTNFLSGEKKYIIDAEGILQEDEVNGVLTGYTSLYENIKKIKFRKNDEEEAVLRNKLIGLIYDIIKKKLFFMDKLLVISPDYRPVFLDDDGRPSMDEINDIYIRIINLSNQIKGMSGSLYDVLAFRMQLLLKDLHEYTQNKVAKKSGMVRNLMLGKRVDFSAMSVISPNPELNVGTIGVPLRIACSIFEPNLIYGLTNSPYSGSIPENFHKAVKDFLGKDLDVSMI